MLADPQWHDSFHRRCLLARAIVGGVDSQDQCRRELLRQLYSAMEPDVGSTRTASSGRVTREAIRGASGGQRTYDYRTSDKRAGESEGKRSSKRLKEDLQNLERRGLVERCPSGDVRVLDWVALLALTSDPVGTAPSR